MLLKMSIDSLVLNISDLDFKCLECVFVKIMEILVGDVQACGIWSFENTSGQLRFLEGNALSSS